MRAISEQTARSLVLARYYLEASKNEFRFINESALLTAVNLLHEAVETVLLAACAHIDAPINSKTHFDGYLKAISDSGTPVPMRALLIRFNQARVSAKHHLNIPNRRQALSFLENIDRFFHDFCPSVFGVELADFSLTLLIEDEVKRKLLLQAADALLTGSYFFAKELVRRAIYLEIEKAYDVSPFLDPKAETKGLLGPVCDAPFYARSQKYVLQNVKTATDYIVIDHTRINNKFLDDGIDPQNFWNIWRITPKVFRFSTGSWVVEEDIAKRDDPDAEANVKYALDTAVEIILRRQHRRKTVRPSDGKLGFAFLTPARQGIPLYAKASLAAPYDSLPSSITMLCSQSLQPSIDGVGRFWSAMHLRKGGPFLSGFVAEDDVQVSNQPPEGWPDF